MAAERHAPGARTSPALITLPGPLPSFLRMAAIGASAPPEEVLQLLAQNVARIGYRGTQTNRSPTEFLVLLKGYLKQTSELQALAGPDGRIQISDCSQAAPLLAILGYSFRQPCGPNALLGVEDPKRAFITMDSGFPLLQLEESIRESRVFTHDFNGSKVPIQSNPSDWSVNGKDVVSSLIDDLDLSRLYSALGRLDEDTRTTLRQSIGLRKLLPRAPILDRYGSHIQIRSGRVLVPGGAPAEPAWKSLVGVGPDSPVAFVTRLLEKDGGWLAAYFDTLARAPRSQQFYFTDARRLPRFYAAWRGRITTPGPDRSTFRPAPGLALLIDRLELGADGQPRIPGGLETWKEILRRHRDTQVDREWAKRAAGMSRAEQLIEALVAMSRPPVRDAAFQVFTVLNEIDRRRSAQQRLSPQAIRLLDSNFPRFRSLYSLFTEWSVLDEESITEFFIAAKGLDSIPNGAVRADAIGTFQAILGLWQILARQEQIAGENINQSWQDLIRSFTGIKSSGKMVDAARASLAALSRAATGRNSLSQNEIIWLLAGPNQDSRDGQQVRGQLAGRIRAAMESQRLVSLDTLFELADGLSRMAGGEAIARDALIRRAGELKEFEVPKPIFSNTERSRWAPGQPDNAHPTLQSRTNLSKIFTATSISAREAADALGLLAPFLRDTLVGLNYAYYEPPGAQVLRNDPMLVRSHDFSEHMTPSRGEAWQESYISGRGVTAGGGAHLAGSLADIPYMLSLIEQDFMVPDSVQALIWEDLVPDLLTSAILPRWWQVTPNELHAVTLYLRFGEDLLTASVRDAGIRQDALDILSDRLYPQRLEQVENLLETENVQEALSHLTPAEIFFLGAEFRERHPQTKTEGTAGKELEELAQQYPNDVNRARISRDFGVPHPAMTLTYSRELFELELLPTFMGYSSRLLAESWESNNLYWARLADEKGYAPVMLHNLVPALTRRMVERISGTHLDDWPAVLRALHETGEEFRSGKIGTGPEVTTTSMPR